MKRNRATTSIKPRRKTLLLLLLLFTLALLAGSFMLPASRVAAARDAEDVKDVEQQLSDNVSEQLGQLDTGMFDSFLGEVEGGAFRIFGANTFKDKMQNILSGETADYGNIFGLIAELFFGEVLKLLPVLAAVVAAAVACNLLGSVREDKSRSGHVIHFVCYLAIVLIVLSVVYQLVNLTVSAIGTVSGFMQLLFPVLLTLMAASGSAASGAIYQPAAALLTGTVSTVITAVIVPLFLASMVLNIVGHFTDNVRIGKFSDFFKSTGQWVLGIVFTVYMAFLSIQGITAATHDSVSIRAVKYAVGNSIPLVGGYLREGFDLILGSTVLIKNAAGTAGLVLLIAYAVTPLFFMVAASLGLKLCAAICEPVCDRKIPDFLTRTAKSFNLLIAAFLSAMFMFFITILLLLMTSNAVLS